MDDIVASSIRFFLQNFTATFTIVGLVIATIIVVVKRQRGHEAIMTYLNWFLLFGIGITYFYNGIMHTVFGDLSAELIGWENNGFQAEVGFASAGMGILAMIAFPRRMPYSTKFAALVVPACFLWGAAGAHIVSMQQDGNFAPLNAGLIVYTDILIPVIGFALWIAAYVTRNRTVRAAADAPVG